MNLILQRYGSTPFGALGKLTGSGIRTLYTVERPWLDNWKSKSCVPLGQYELIWRPTTTAVPSSFGGHTWYLRGDQVGFDGDGKRRQNCAFHIGNTFEDVTGCVAVGNELGYVKSKWGIISSRNALEYLLEELGTDDQKLSIIGSLMG